jgi:TonB family protein
VNAQGDTEIEYTLGINGRIEAARIAKASGESDSHKLLDMLALDAVKACRGSPRIVNGNPMQVVGRVSYAWRLVDEKKPVKRGNQSLDMNACKPPIKTNAATRAEAVGITLISYSLDLDGKVTAAEVQVSAGPTREHKQLDRAALEAVKACAGKPNTTPDAVGSVNGAIQINWK